MTVWFMVVFPSDVVLLGQATSWAPCHVFNEHLRVDSTPEARFPLVTSGMPCISGTGRTGRTRALLGVRSPELGAIASRVIP